MTFTDLKKTKFWGAPRHWIGFWVKKKKKGKKRKEKKQPTTSSNTSTECHQHQERPVQIGRYPFRNHTSFSSVLLLIQFDATYLFLHARSSSCMHGRWWYSLRLSVTAGLSSYRHVGLHERVPPDSRKARRSIIQPQHPANLNAAAPSFQSKMLSGSARLWHSACNVMFAGTALNSIPQALTAVQGETVSEEHPRSTSRRDGINKATWDEHHNNKKTSLSREHQRVFGLSQGRQPSTIVHSKKTEPWQPQLVGWYERRPLHDPYKVFAYWSKKKTTTFGAKTIVGRSCLKIWVLGVVPSRCRLNTAVCGRSKYFFLVIEHFQASWLSFFRVARVVG